MIAESCSSNGVGMGWLHIDVGNQRGESWNWKGLVVLDLGEVERWC